MSESENFNKLIRLLASGGTKVLRKLLDKHSSPLSFSDYIYRNQATVLKLKFYENQRDLVIARDIDKMDITLLGKLSLDLFKGKMTVNEKDCVNKIKEERDKFLHSDVLETAKVATPLFDRRWQEISNILLDLADEIEPVLRDDLQTLIDEVKRTSPDLTEIHKTLVEWCASNKELEKKIENLTTKVQKLSVKQEPAPTRNSKLEALTDKFQCQYDYATRLNTQITGKMKSAKDTLLRENSVLLYGKAMEGKTTAAFIIAKSLAADKAISLDRCAVLIESTDLKDLRSTDVDLLLIEDIFGKHNAESGKFRDWSLYFQTLQSFVETRKVKIIITSRLHIFLEYKNKLSGLPIFSRSVELNSVDLTNREKEDILKAQLNAYDRDIDDVDIQDCLSKFNSNSGFPMCAHQFAANTDLYLMKSNFFRRPYKYYLEQNIHNLDEQSFMTLLFVFYKHNQLTSAVLDITKIDKMSENLFLHIAKLRGLDISLTKVVRDTRQKVNWLKGSYLKITGKTISFLHDTIYETVALIHSEEYPSEVIAYCTIDFLCQCIAVDGDIKEGIMVVNEDEFGCLAERFISEVIKCNHGKRLSAHPFLGNQQFAKELISTLSENPDTLHKFLSINLSFMYNGIHAFLYHAVLDQTSDVFFGEVLSQLDCNHRGEMTETCWKCSVRSEALAAVCGANRQDLYQALLNKGATVQTLCLYKAVENHDINPDFVKRIYSDLKNCQKFISDKELLQFCLGMSSCNKDNRVFKILTDSGLKPTSELVYYIVKKDDSSLLSSTIEQLEKNGTWKPDTMSVSRALVEAHMQKKERCLEILENAGGKMTEFAVYWAIVDYGYDAVSDVIGMLKRNDTFDVESPDLAWGLAMAIKIQADDDRYHKRLKEEGVIYTLSVVGALAEIGISADKIREVIDELKKDGQWNTEDYAVAAAYMAARKRPDKSLLTVLESEGSGITPACLNYAVIRYADQLEFIIQSLKTAKTFDLSDKYIARAFVWSIESPDKLVYHRLLVEGVRISMACLVYAVERFISLPTLDRVIEDLQKDEKWNTEDDYALEALCIASKRQDRRGYEKLLREGISWKSRSLYVAVQCVSVYGVKHVIERMKEHGVLDKNHEHIRNAVASAKAMKDQRKYVILQEYLTADE